MKPYSYQFLAAFAVTAVGMALTGCQQAPPVAATPAPTTTVVEEVHHDDARHDDAHKVPDRDHPRPDDSARRDHPDGPDRH